MYTYAQNIVQCIFGCFMVSSLWAAQPTLETDDSGKQHILALMSHAEAKVHVAGDKSDYAKTQNVAQDLGIADITKFFGCKTEVGNWYLQETLSKPCKMVDGLVAQRQAWIRMLVENPELKQQIDTLLDQAREHEQEVMVLLSDFFKGRTCPELKQLELAKEKHPWLHPFNKFCVHSSIIRSLGFVQQCLTQGAVLFGLYKIAENYASIKEALPELKEVWQNMKLEHKAVVSIYGCIYAALEGWLVYTLYKDCATAAEKRTKIHALNQLMNISVEMETLAANAGLSLQNTFSAQIQKDTSGVLNGVKANRYTHKKSYLFAVPLVHTFLYNLYEQEHQLAPLFASIAEMDAYNAIATKILESQAHHNKFCFATFIDAEKPGIETIGFWNVLVKKPVVNSIAESHNIILTGPNAGGKTTSIRALLQNIILAQTYGVAAAEQFACTPFEVIHSYLNISDDLINGLSLFASEVKRAQGIVETIKNLQPGEKYFCALDELFTGTVAEDGETCAYQFVKRIVQCDHAFFIYATHFSKLTTLEANAIGCINYKVDAPHKDDRGKLVYPYTLSRGINDARVALDLAGEANLFA